MTPIPAMITDPATGKMIANPLFVEGAGAKSDDETVSLQRAVPPSPSFAAILQSNLQAAICPPFDGTTGFQTWQKMCEFNLTTWEIETNKWPFCMGRALVGHAEPLWTNLVATNDPAIRDYELFSTALRTNFAQQADHLRYFNLLELAQGHRPFSAYEQEFSTLSTGLDLPPPFDVIFFANGLNRREKATVLKLSSVKEASAALRAEEIARRDAPSTSSGQKFNYPKRVQRSEGLPARTGYPSRQAQLNAIAATAATFPAHRRLTAELREYYEAHGCKYCRTIEHTYKHCSARRSAPSHVRAAENVLRQ